MTSKWVASCWLWGRPVSRPPVGVSDRQQVYRSCCLTRPVICDIEVWEIFSQIFSVGGVAGKLLTCGRSTRGIGYHKFPSASSRTIPRNYSTGEMPSSLAFTNAAQRHVWREDDIECSKNLNIIRTGKDLLQSKPKVARIPLRTLDRRIESMILKWWGVCRAQKEEKKQINKMKIKAKASQEGKGR